MESGMNSRTDNWYETVAAKELTKVLSELRDKQLPHIPFENLLDCPEWVDLEQLCKLLNDDGIPAVVWKYSDLTGDSGVVIRIR